MGDSSTNGSSGTAEEHLLALVEEFTLRVRAGSNPEVEDFVARLPGRAEEVRELLATVEALEGTLPDVGEGGAVGGLERLGGYRIEREIGRGGMGIVLLAVDESLDRRVAIKLLPHQATLDPRYLARFQREARAAARLEHPNIVPVYGIGHEEGLHFFAMQYVEGCTLDHIVQAIRCSASGPAEGAASSSATIARKLRSVELSSGGGGWYGAEERTGTGSGAGAANPLGDVQEGAPYFRNVAHIGIQVAEALAYAHSCGVLHRDVKPGNLMLEPSGRVWVTDFGLCKSTEADPLTTVSDMVGTLRYMAPEQTRGTSDVRSDVYGLGATLYELVARRPPFEAKERAELLRQVTRSSPPGLRRIDGRIPRDLETIVKKAMAELPEERYGTADALGEDLRAFLDGGRIAARPPSAAYFLRLAVRRHRELVVTAAAAFAVVITLSVLYLVGIQRSNREQRRQLYLADVAAAQAAVGVDARSAAARLEGAPEEHRNWEWGHLRALADQSLRTRPEDHGLARTVDVTPDGRLELVGQGPRVLVRELVPPGREWVLEGCREHVETAALAPHGRYAVAGDVLGQVFVWALEDPVRVVGERTLDAGVGAVVFDREGERVFVGTREGELLVLDTELRLVRELGGHAAWLTALHRAPAGELVASGSVDGRVRVWGPGGELLLDLEHDGGVWAVAIDPLEELVAAGGETGYVRVWDVPTGELRHTLTDRARWIRSLAFDPAGERLAAGTIDRTIHLWNLTTGFARELHGHAHWVDGLSFRANDGLLVSAANDGTVKEWNVDGAGGELVLTGHVADYWNVSFGPRSRRLVTTSRDGTARVWDAEDGTHLRTFFPGHGATLATFSPDGATLAVGDFAGQLHTYDLERGVQLDVFGTLGGERGAFAPVTALGFDAVGHRLYAGLSRWGLEVWEPSPEGWRLAEDRRMPDLAHLALSPDGTRLAIATIGGVVRVVTVPEFETVFEDRLHEGGVSLVAFRADGGALASGGDDGHVILRHAATGAVQEELALEDHSSYLASRVRSMGFNHDGSRLVASSGGAGTALWDPERGELILSLRGAGRGYARSAFSPDGLRIAQGFSDGRLRILDTLHASERCPARLDESLSREADRVHADLGDAALDLDRLPGRLDELSLADDLFEAVLCRAHAAAGTWEALASRCHSLLRGPSASRTTAQQAMYIASGLHKEDLAGPESCRLYGEALYRIDRYGEALPLLQNARRLAEASGEPSFDAFVFLCLTTARLGRTEEARAWLERAREVARSTSRSEEDEVRVLLAEARRVIDEVGASEAR